MLLLLSSSLSGNRLFCDERLVPLKVAQISGKVYLDSFRCTAPTELAERSFFGMTIAELKGTISSIYLSINVQVIQILLDNLR